MMGHEWAVRRAQPFRGLLWDRLEEVLAEQKAVHHEALIDQLERIDVVDKLDLMDPWLIQGISGSPDA
jgi:hypothetical protein